MSFYLSGVFNLHYVVSENFNHPKGETFASDPHSPGISTPGVACHPAPWNIRNFSTWLGTLWKEYLSQKCCCTIYILLCKR